jgi:hypothetical protein
VVGVAQKDLQTKSLGMSVKLLDKPIGNIMLPSGAEKVEW